MNIRENYLAFGQPDFGDAEVAAVTRALRSGWVGMGPETIAFENDLEEYLGATHVVTVNSCTSALFLSLVALGVGPGDEVICPSLTWCATANAALYLGAKPIFCDIDPQTLCATAATISAKLSSRTKAVMVVHFGGLAADVAAIREALPGHVAIVEDAAHAMGGRYADGRRVGASGNLTCFSFYANKNLSTGEGGAIALHDGDLAARLRSLRQNGLNADAWKRYIQPRSALTPRYIELGYKMNYTDLQATIGRVQLRRQTEFGKRRMDLAERLYAALSGPGLGVRFQHQVLDAAHSRHLFIVLLPVEKMRCSRDDLVLALRERKIGASIHYPPLHTIPLYEPYSTGDLPQTEFIGKWIMTLPISASMSLQDADCVAENFVELMTETRSNQ